MKNRIIVLAGIVLLWASALFGQEQKPAPPELGGKAKAEQPAAPKLKPEVALELVKEQKAQALALLQMKNIEAQYSDLQKKFNEAQARYLAKYGTALKDSGIDDKKYDLNSDTLEVTAKPPAPAPPAPKKE